MSSAFAVKPLAMHVIEFYEVAKFFLFSVFFFLGLNFEKMRIDVETGRGGAKGVV